MKPFPEDTKLIIWDMDGVLFPLRVRALAFSPSKTAQVAVHLGKTLSVEQIKKLGTQAGRRRLSTMLTCDSFTTEGLPSDANLIEAMAISDPAHAVLTQSHSAYAVDALKSMGVTPVVIPEKHIFGLDSVGYKKKREGPDSLEHVLSCFPGVQPHEVIMVDDKVKNLKHAHEMGMYTVGINKNNRKNYIPEATPPWVDSVFKTPSEFIQAYNQQKNHKHSQGKDTNTGFYL